MSAVEITPSTYIGAARRLALDSANDFVYPQIARSDGSSVTCHYVRDGKASCYIGSILAILGVPVDVLASYEGMGAYALLDNLEHNGDIKFRGPSQKLKIQRFSSAAQEAQDNENTWKDAYIAASAHLL